MTSKVIMPNFFDDFRQLAKGPAINAPTPDSLSPLRTLRAYEGNALTYVAEGPMDADEADAVWRIRKVFLDGQMRTTDIQTLEGSWLERATLPWRERRPE